MINTEIGKYDQVHIELGEKDVKIILEMKMC